jgi:GT2 family glycosyltransferase/glycosyltransferase involved in cell wall biosynthesis
METIVLIPHHNNTRLLDECLNSLRKQTYKNFKIVVVDDASTDDSVEHLRANFPEIDIRTLARNKGFARAVNYGIVYALKKYSPEFIAILNNDTTVGEQWIEVLVARTKTDPTIAAVTSNMFFADHPEIINSQGGTIDWNGDGYDINFGISRERGKKESSEVVGACFGAALIRSAAFRNVGLLDGAFGAYFEDLDWSWRAHLYGYRILFEPKAIVYHKHSASYNQTPYKKLYYCKRNALRAALKNYEKKYLFRSILYILIGYWFAIVGYFQTSKHRLPFLKKLGFVSIPFYALFWNVINLPATLKNRKKIQRERTVPDETIMRLAEQDFAPVREWLKHLKEKIPMLKKATARPPIHQQDNKPIASIPRELEALRERLMCDTLPGDAPAEEVFLRVNDNTVHEYFETISTYLPFHLFMMRKEDFFKNESALVIDACVFFFQLPLRRNEKNFEMALGKIRLSAQHLKHAKIDWEKSTTIAKTINASSQLYGYLRLVNASEDTPIVPGKTLETLKRDGSRMQNMLINRFQYEKLKRGRIPFSLKLYLRMYREHGLLRYCITRLHSFYNKKTRSVVVQPRHMGGGDKLKESPELVISHGVNIFGFLDSESGVGEAARTLTRAVMQKGIPHALLNSPRCPHRRKENEFSKKFSAKNPYAVNIIVFYGDVFASELRAFGEKKFRGKYNIAYWAWELSSLPASWAALLGNVDEIWTPSSFSAKAIHEAKKDIPITIIPHAITMRKCPYPRKRFGVPDDMFLFLFTFDFYSIFERKNPLAIVRAFKNAFRLDEPVGLVIKSSNHTINLEDFAKLQKESEAHNIFLLNDCFSRDEISSLMNVCDAYVSLHRSEGFGLTIAESMMLGKPVIATNYSGNTDFLNEENGFPIPYTLVPLEKDYGPYKKGNVWANPDEEKAAEAMRMIYSHHEIAGRKGGRARNDMIAKLSPVAVADAVSQRLAHIKIKVLT